jgi:large subunit ribosomal protein L24
MPSKVKFDRPAKAPKCHVRAGDRVIVIAGKAKGKTGMVIKVFPFEQRALLDGEAVINDTKHVRPNPQANIEGGRKQQQRPIHISNLALLDPTTNKPARVRHERTADGVVRVAKKSGHKFAVAR